jgi:hypothetical protein
MLIKPIYSSESYEGYVIVGFKVNIFIFQMHFSLIIRGQKFSFSIVLTYLKLSDTEHSMFKLLLINYYIK